MKNIIVAYDHERAIGVRGELPWEPGEMKADMRRFRERTMGNALIMGRKTLESIGIALPGRKTIVCSRSEISDIPGVDTARSLEEAYDMARDYKEIFVVGGGEIYKQSIDGVDCIYATEVGATIEGADVYFPNIDQSWREIERQNFPSDKDNRYPYSFVTYEREK